GADIKVKEPDFQAMARGKRKFLPPRYMTVRQAAAILLEIGKRRREEGVDTTVTTLSGSTLRVCEPTSLAVAVCRIGMATQLITSGTLEQLARSDCGPPLHSLVLVGETHELEDALLARMAIDAEPGKGPRPAPGDAVGELPPPARATLLEPEDIEVWDIPAAGDPRPGGEASIGAAVVGVPAAAAAATSDAGEFRKLWLSAVGSGHASLSARQDWRSSLARASDEIGFKQVRFHGIFDDDMSSFLPGPQAGPAGSNMINTFNTFDFLDVSSRRNAAIPPLPSELGMAPLMELSFMPRGLMSTPEDQVPPTIMHYRGIHEPPKNWSQWDAFVEEFMTNVWERYQSPFIVETFNEPNCGELRKQALRGERAVELATSSAVELSAALRCAGFYVGNGCGKDSGNKTAYFELYKHTSEAIRRANPAFRAAGPVTAQLGWIEEFLTWAVDEGNAPVDLVTSHLYPTDPIVNQTDRFGWVEQVTKAAEAAARRGLNFTLSEFNAGLESNWDYRDGVYTGAFLGHVALAAQRLPPNVEGLSFWTFSDVFEEQGFASAPFHGGFGLSTVHDVNKAGWCVMQLLSQHGDTALGTAASGAHPGDAAARPQAAGASIQSVDLAATRRAADGAVVLSLANFQPNGLAPPPTVTVNVTVSGLASGADRTATVHRVDDSSCNPLAVWRQAGSPVYPSKALVSAMRAAANPAVSSAVCHGHGSAQQACTLTLQLPSMGVALVELR
ncbi:xynB, partial [Symbiodinium sp. KB8]